MVAEVRGLVVKHRAANPLGLSDESLSNALCDEEDSQMLAIFDLLIFGFSRESV
jgi:hypothetical protein